MLYSKFDEYGHEDKEDVPPPLHRLRLPIIVVEDKQRQPTSDVVDITQPAIYKVLLKGTKRKKKTFWSPPMALRSPNHKL